MVRSIIVGQWYKFATKDDKRHWFEVVNIMNAIDTGSDYGKIEDLMFTFGNKALLKLERSDFGYSIRYRSSMPSEDRSPYPDEIIYYIHPTTAWIRIDRNEEETKMCQPNDKPSNKPNNNPNTQIVNVLKRQELFQLSRVDSDFEIARDELFNKNPKALQLLELAAWLHESEMSIDEVVIFEIIVTKILSKEELKEYNELIDNHLEARKKIKHMFEELNALLSITDTYEQKWQLLKHYKVI